MHASIPLTAASWQQGQVQAEQMEAPHSSTNSNCRIVPVLLVLSQGVDFEFESFQGGPHACKELHWAASTTPVSHPWHTQLEWCLKLELMCALPRERAHAHTLTLVFSELSSQVENGDGTARWQSPLKSIVETLLTQALGRSNQRHSCWGRVGLGESIVKDHENQKSEIGKLVNSWKRRAGT